MSAASARDAYAFVCLECRHAWDEVFEIRQTVDAHGTKLAVWFQRGLMVPSPLTDAVCPQCQSRSVRILTRGRVMRPRGDAGRDAGTS